MSNLLYILPINNENQSLNKDLLEETSVVKNFLNAGQEDIYSLLQYGKILTVKKYKKIF